MEAQPIYEFTSHIGGKNAKISIFADRVEWLKPRGVSGGKVTAGILTGGLSMLATGVKNGKTATEMIPVKSISSVTTKRDGFSNTLVQVITSGNTVDFRVSHKEAEAVKQVLTQLVVGLQRAESMQSTPDQPAVSTPAASDIPTQLQQLAGLHAAGILSDVEFSQKKAELLSRM
jgi:hypothetical protein